MCLLFSCPKDNNKHQQSFFHAVIYPTPQVCIGRVLVAAAINEMGFRNTKTVKKNYTRRNNYGDRQDS